MDGSREKLFSRVGNGGWPTKNRQPVYVGDVMCIYNDLTRVGRTSIRVHVEAWVIRRNQTSRFLVTEGNFTYVALDDERRPRHVQQ
jgi:acyl-CoA thioesterase YciA